MTDIAVATPAPIIDKLKDAAPEVLEAERRRIVASANGDYKNISEDDLMILAFVTSTLRRRASGPPKKPKEPKGVAKVKPTLGSLGDLL